jgi:excisionase family DNA binding protein
MPEVTDLITTAEAANYLQVRPEKFLTLGAQGPVAFIRLGDWGGFRFRRQDLEELTPPPRTRS